MVKGLAQFEARYRAIPKNVREAAREALEENAKEIVTLMRRLAPKGDSGRLKDSINWTWGKAPKGTLTLGKVAGREYGTLRITIYAGGGDAFYAKFQEFGTSKMTANPYFFPAWRAQRRRAKTRVTRSISKAIRTS